MSIGQWIRDHMVEERSEEPRIKLRRIIYNLNGGDSLVDFYACNKCGECWQGLGKQFIITKKDKKDSTKDLDGLESENKARALLGRLKQAKHTSFIVLCHECYNNHA